MNLQDNTTPEEQSFMNQANTLIRGGANKQTVVKTLVEKGCSKDDAEILYHVVSNLIAQFG